MSSSRLATRALGVFLAPLLVTAALAAAPPGEAVIGPQDDTYFAPAFSGPHNIPEAIGSCGVSPASPVEIPINVAGLPSQRISGIRVEVGLTHTYQADLRMTLTAPGGAAATLLPGCAGDGDNLGGVYGWDDTAPTSMTNANPPTAGTWYKPQDNMVNAFSGLTHPNGIWTLRIWDLLGGDTGTAGNFFRLQIVLDDTDPNTSITSGPANGSPAGPVEVHFNGTDNVGIGAFNCSFDGGPLTACTSPYTTNASPGSHSLSVQAVDTSSNTDPTPDLYTWETAAPPDTTPPNTAITGGPADGDTVSVLPSYSFNSPDDDTATFECSLDGGAYAACTSPYQVADGTSAAEHTFAVRAKDPAGNVDPTPSSRDFTYDPTPPDTTPPQTNIIGGPENGAGVKSPPTYRFSSPDSDADGFVCSIDDKAFKPCTTPFTVSGIAPGNHSFEVSAVDEAGNVDPTPALRTFKLRDLCAEAKAKLRQARIKLREAIEDGASKRKIRRLRGQVNKWKAEVRDLC
ncbi:subtilisin-like proprotein convertase family protein [Nocardioides thalensis]|uniref:Subtilisin-like proprotein convertase family protein n=1 Tax=Nocardioides thalensis TaxID=1914755 RepID=A0A853C8D1_9ACTN|nr:proprotein convertase P-domain-containing protein [Nocardioides thalensis]NYJ03469.1 subtilisin-like proprotein convertase family protein [Nocardioides thalensis]